MAAWKRSLYDVPGVGWVYLYSEDKGDPLVVVSLGTVLVDRVHVHHAAQVLLILLLVVVPSVHPAVVVHHLVRIAVEAAGDGFTEVGLGHSDGGPQHADDGGDFVVEFEDNVVDVDLVKSEVAHQVGEQMVGHSLLGRSDILLLPCPLHTVTLLHFELLTQSFLIKL